jgi:hypothetical protein
MNPKDISNFPPEARITALAIGIAEAALRHPGACEELRTNPEGFARCCRVMAAALLTEVPPIL